MAIPVQLQQQILNHMLSVAPGDMLSWHLAGLVARLAQQQAPGNNILPGVPTLPQATHSAPIQPHVQSTFPSYAPAAAQLPTFQQGSSHQVVQQLASQPESASATLAVKRERRSCEDFYSRFLELNVSCRSD